MKRLLTYLKPHIFAMIMSLILTLLIIVLELYRPIIIGDAIDNYINSYYRPYAEVSAEDDTTVNFRGKIYTKEFDKDNVTGLIQLYQCGSKYYLFSIDSMKTSDLLSKYNEEEAVVSADGKSLTVTLDGVDYTGELLSTEELEIIRVFLGIYEDGVVRSLL